MQIKQLSKDNKNNRISFILESSTVPFANSLKTHNSRDSGKSSSHAVYNNKQPLLYSSKQELWADHCFEPLLKWTKEKLLYSNRLHLISSEGCTHVLIKKRGDIKKSDCTYILPVVQNRKSRCGMQENENTCTESE